MKTVTAPATETTAAPEASGVSKRDAKRVARTAVLRLEDFPSGWQQEDPSDEQASEDTCEAITAAKRTVVARASSDEFSDDGDQTAEVVNYIFGTEAEAERHFDAFTSDATRACLKKILPKALGEALAGEDAKVGETTTSRVSIERSGTLPPCRG